MALNLPPVDHTRSNEPFKSTGEDRLVVRVDGQMTDTTMIWHAKGERTNGAVAVFEVIWGPHDKSVHHVHTLEDEGFYVIEGSMTLHTPEGDVELGPGEFGWGPRYHRHAYSVGPHGARVLVVQVPGTDLYSFFKGSAEVGDLSGEGAFDEWAAWAQENFGARVFHPAECPPGQSIVDGERVPAGA